MKWLRMIKSRWKRWEYNLLPAPGTDCWVTDGKHVWYAYFDPHSAGGWTNGDCWEDSDGGVVAWMKIPRPKPPMDRRMR